VAQTRNEEITTQPAIGEAWTCAAVVKAHPPQLQEQPITDITKKDAESTLHTTDMTVTQQLQLVLEKLDKQEKVHKTLVSRLDKLEKATFLRSS
jgi:hypothetical protein